ncbi:hypothetical protein BaRGS_00015333 [Batillaria attramentaria]|uniref:Uncharacterized protein n=1 Tax=Batillaria attramentaria TaxID=370345 RepID=A0ABD0L1M5_9CAEN
MRICPPRPFMENHADLQTVVSFTHINPCSLTSVVTSWKRRTDVTAATTLLAPSCSSGLVLLANEATLTFKSGTLRGDSRLQVSRMIAHCVSPLYSDISLVRELLSTSSGLIFSKSAFARPFLRTVLQQPEGEEWEGVGGGCSPLRQLHRRVPPVRNQSASSVPIEMGRDWDGGKEPSLSSHEARTVRSGTTVTSAGL